MQIAIMRPEIAEACKTRDLISQHRHEDGIIVLVPIFEPNPAAFQRIGIVGPDGGCVQNRVVHDLENAGEISLCGLSNGDLHLDIPSLRIRHSELNEESDGKPPFDQ